KQALDFSKIIDAAVEQIRAQQIQIDLGTVDAGVDSPATAHFVADRALCLERNFTKRIGEIVAGGRDQLAKFFAALSLVVLERGKRHLAAGAVAEGVAAELVSVAQELMQIFEAELIAGFVRRVHHSRSDVIGTANSEVAENRTAGCVGGAREIV